MEKEPFVPEPARLFNYKLAWNNNQLDWLPVANEVIRLAEVVELPVREEPDDLVA